MAVPVRYPNGVTNRPGNHVFASLPVLDPTKYVVFHDDFTSATIAAANITGWHLDEIDTNTASVDLAVGDAHGGVATFTVGTAADDNTCYQWATNTVVHEIFKLQPGKKAWMRCRFKLEDADKDKFMIGLHIAADDVLGTEPSDQFVFRSGATADVIQLAAGKTNATEVAATIGTATDDTWVIATAYYDGGGKVYGWTEATDGTIAAGAVLEVTSSTAGDLMPDTEMTVGFAMEGIDTGSDVFSIDYLTIICER